MASNNDRYVSMRCYGVALIATLILSISSLWWTTNDQNTHIYVNINNV
jgi:hypothetical protein